jgi:AbiV family abortive infection protein
VDLGAVRVAETSELVKGAVGAAANARSLLDDAELLYQAGRWARACSLAALAVEEVGKAESLATLAMLRENLRAQAPLGRMLEWHELKLVGGLLIAAVPLGEPTLLDSLAAMPASEVTEVLNSAKAFAQDEDWLKQRGLYVDIDRTGGVTLPSDITEAQVCEQLSRARQAALAASVLLEPDAPARLAKPRHDEVELCRALVGAFAEAGYARTPEAAAGVVRKVVSNLQAQRAANA